VTRTETAVTSRFDLDLGVTEAVVAANRKLDIQILRIADDHAAADVAERLEVPLGAPVLAVERVIRADDVPAAHALDVIPEAALAGAGAARYEGGSVYRFLEERCGLELAGGMADVTATSAGRTLARQLGVSPGAVLLRMEQVERTADELAVLFSREHYVPPCSTSASGGSGAGGRPRAKEEAGDVFPGRRSRRGARAPLVRVRAAAQPLHGSVQLPVHLDLKAVVRP
jgi:hypothetical protein